MLHLYLWYGTFRNCTPAYGWIPIKENLDGFELIGVALALGINIPLQMHSPIFVGTFYLCYISLKFNYLVGEGATLLLTLFVFKRMSEVQV